jgi:hypothetical protein
MAVRQKYRCHSREIEADAVFTLTAISSSSSVSFDSNLSEDIFQVLRLPDQTGGKGEQ